MKRVAVALALAVAVSLAALPARLEAQVAQIPKHPDELTYKPFTYTPPSAKDYRAVLAAGPVVYIAEDHELPLVSISVTFRGGTYLTPSGKEGLAQMVGNLLSRGGAKGRTAEELDERVAFLAANLSSSIGDDRGGASINLLSKDLDEGLTILREVLTEPRFQESRLRILKQQMLNEMKERNDDSADIEARERGFLAYGEAFYTNRYTTKASVESITREDLLAFHRKWFDARNAMVAVSGDFKRAEMLKKLEAFFAKWPVKGEAAPPVPKPAHRIPAGLFIVDKDVNQGRVSILLPGVARDDPDYFAAIVMNDILGGGGFTSRITNRVRSDEGLAYHASSGLSGGVWYPGLWTGVFQSKVRTCAFAAQVLMEEMKGMRDFGTKPARAAAEKDELTTSQKSFVETLPRRFPTKAAIVGGLLDEEYTGRYRKDPEFFAKFRQRIEAVTPADVQRAARRLLTPESVAILVVGKKAELLNPDPAHPVAFASLAGGKLTDLPLRDPFTLKPMAPAVPAAQ